MLLNAPIPSKSKVVGELRHAAIRKEMGDAIPKGPKVGTDPTPTRPTVQHMVRRKEKGDAIPRGPTKVGGDTTRPTVQHTVRSKENGDGKIKLKCPN